MLLASWNHLGWEPLSQLRRYVSIDQNLVLFPHTIWTRPQLHCDSSIIREASKAGLRCHFLHHHSAHMPTFPAPELFELTGRHTCSRSHVSNTAGMSSGREMQTSMWQLANVLRGPGRPICGPLRDATCRLYMANNCLLVLSLCQPSILMLYMELKAKTIVSRLVLREIDGVHVNKGSSCTFSITWSGDMAYNKDMIASYD